MPGGSIGVSGPRGAGKSTLIRAACPTARSGSIVGVLVAAPVQFNAREFILHLFAELCQTILGPKTVEQLRTPSAVGRLDLPPRLVRRTTVALAAVLVAGGEATLLVGLTVKHINIPTAVVWGAVAMLAGGAVGFGGYLLRYRRPVARGPAGGRRDFNGVEDTIEATNIPKEAQRLAVRRLQNIWFQQTFTTGWSGALTLPLGLSGGLTGTTQLAQQQMSMPDIVGELRTLVTAITEPPTSESAQPTPKINVHIGIDELDKIESPKAARQFMNEIKVLFGIEDCFFIVSVSEDAMSDFDRRGLPFRDVFDSSFDDIVRVGYLDAQSSISLIQERVVGMPIPFILLGHCVAGGLPRDLIRVARDMITLNVNAATTGMTVSDMCAALIQADVRSKAQSSAVAARRTCQGSQLTVLQSWLRTIGGSPVTVDALHTACANARRPLEPLLTTQNQNGKQRTPAALASEFLAFCLFASTLLEVFSPDREPEYFEAMAAVENGSAPIDRLAEARQAFVTSPQAAWEALVLFRRDHIGGGRQVADTVPIS